MIKTSQMFVEDSFFKKVTEICKNQGWNFGIRAVLKKTHNILYAVKIIKNLKWYLPLGFN